MKIEKTGNKPYTMKRYLLFVFLMILSIAGKSQEMPDIMPHSPEAKGFGKYGDIPISLYTGAPDISIPIYTARSGSLSLPVTLSYHASGIEVSQEATWVGLGWNLIAGGSISYIPVGGHDKSYYRLNPYEFDSIHDYMEMDRYPMLKNEDGPVCWAGSFALSPSQKMTTFIMKVLLKGTEEQDVYSANFLSYSFKFIKHPVTDSVFFLGQKNKCKFEGGFNTSGIIITGEDGTKYYFESTESDLVAVSSWFLTKVKSPAGDSITLNYKKVPVKKLPPLSESFRIMSGAILPGRYVSQTYNLNNLYLERIETKNELIIFESDTNRTDLHGALRLTRIVIKDKFKQAEKFSYQFVYDYFTGNCTDDNYLNDGFCDQYKNDFSSDEINKRLKLISLVQSSGTAENEKYIFTYNEQVTLPAKTSFAMDHWGYYNGRVNGSDIITGSQHTIIPNLFPLLLATSSVNSEIPGEFYTFNGAVRGASKNYITAGMLQSIQYPTKGKTVFEYEPHDFENYKYISAEDEISNNGVFKGGASVYAYYNFQYNVTESTFTIYHGTYIHFTGQLNTTSFSTGKITIEADSVPGFIPKIYQWTGQTTGPDGLLNWDENIWLTPGVYKLKCDVPTHGDSNYGSPPPISGTVNYRDYNEDILSTLKFIGGGLRIKTITNYDENNNIVLSKRYSYINEDGKTSGKLLVPLRNYEHKVITVGNYYPEANYSVKNEKDEYTLHGSSYVSLSSLPCGNNVGYDRVVVESYNSTDNNGKEISYFYNSPVYLHFEKIPYFEEVSNGNLKNKILLKSNGDTLLKENYNYAILPGTEISKNLNVFAEDLYQGPTDIIAPGTGGHNPLAYVGRFRIYSYPTRNYWNTLTKKETTHHFPNGDVTETAEYTYNPENYCIKSSTVSTSISNIKKITEFKYPFNYAVAPYTTMKNIKNMLTPVIEQTEKTNTTTLQTTKTNYKDWFNDQKIIAPENVVTTTGSSPSDIRIRYKYNRQGNISEAQKENDIKTCYLWGYNNSFPVVKIVGKGESDVLQSLKDAISGKVFSCKSDYTSINSDMNWLKTKLSSLLTDNTCSVTFYTYDPIYGMTSQTDPNGKSIYYEYDSFGRLKCIKDHNGHILKMTDYHYKNQ